MVSPVDLMGRIQQYYREGEEVPYMAFMNILNELFSDPVTLEPRVPSDELRETFRAACMAVSVGVDDKEGRAEQRVREFREKIYPFWEEKVPAEEFKKFEDICKGAASKKQANGPGATLSADVSDASVALLKRLGLVEGAGDAAAAPGAPAGEAGPSADAAFASIDDLCQATLNGKLRADYSARFDEKDFATYRIGDLDVAVRLAEADGHKYAIFLAGRGYSGLSDAEPCVDECAAEMGYLRMGSFAYLRQGDRLVCTLKVWPEKLTIACAAKEQGESDELVPRLRAMHKDLIELAQRMQA